MWLGFFCLVEICGGVLVASDSITDKAENFWIS